LELRTQNSGPRFTKARCRDGTYGPLHKRNGPKSRVPVFKPDPKVVAYYERLKAAGEEMARWLGNRKA